MKPLPQKYAMGSDWLAAPVCRDWLNSIWCASKRHTPLVKMCFGCIVNNGVVYIAYQFETRLRPRDISEEDRAEHTTLNGMVFVCCCLKLLDTLLFVNATAYVSF